MGIPGEQDCFKKNDNDKGTRKMKKKKEKHVSSSGGGLAAPVQELPRGVFLQKKMGSVCIIVFQQ